MKPINQHDITILPRCYLDMIWTLGQLVVLPNKSTHHLMRVRRLKKGDEIMLFNGRGHWACARLVGNDQVMIERVGQDQPSMKGRLFIGQLILRPSAMDWMIEKITELGVDSFQPLYDRHTPLSHYHTKKYEHWVQKMISACVQSGRNYCMAIEAPLSIEQWINRLQISRRFVLDCHATQVWSMDDEVMFNDDIMVVMGAESGFVKADLQRLRDAQFLPLRICQHTLRAETSAMSMAAWHTITKTMARRTQASS